MGSEGLFLTISNNLSISRTKLDVFQLIFVDWEGCSAPFSVCSAGSRSNFADTIAKLRPNSKAATPPKKVPPARLLFMIRCFL